MSSLSLDVFKFTIKIPASFLAINNERIPIVRQANVNRKFTCKKSTRSTANGKLRS